jgi:photosystem II stability/assembly factor-like uncharacterized protein
MKTIPRLLSFLIASAPALPAQTASPQTLAGLRARDIGPATMSGRVVDLAVNEANPTTFYVATATGGVWKTANNGVTWMAVFEREATHSVGAIAVSQVDTNQVWVGTGERANRQSNSWGDGVYKSTDGGKAWRHVGLRQSNHVGRIAIHPQDPNTVFIAAMGHLWGPNEERGLYKTTDGGGTWRRVLYVDTLTGVVDVAIDPSDPNTMYAASYQRMRKAYGFHGGGPGSALWKSTDGGETWSKLTNGLPASDKGRIGISIYRKDPRIVYVSVEQGYRYNASTQYTAYAAGVYRSEDQGQTWEHMSTWNPRPMYASQILVDPNDDQRIYMENDFSYSDDGGKTFRSAPQSLHSDDRILWVNARDSRHLIKGDDGGVGISYDKAATWLYVTNLPVSQWYRIAVDNRNPYWVYGGLQDNGAWMGPSANWVKGGIRFDDWHQIGGGDGFQSRVDTVTNRTVYAESQYLGLTRVDLVTHEVKDIRPGDPKGAIADRRNWDAWGPGLPEPELANAMAPANWDAPFIISPHDANTLYAGTNKLWKSPNRGDTWIDLGDLTTKVNRRDLPIMGQRAGDSTASLDDGIPYYPTLSALAESPAQRGLLYAGTDDGNLQVSRDDGKIWTNVADRIPGLPPTSWIAGIEPSRFDAGTVYVVADNHRSNDYHNYVFASPDFGQTWTSISSDLPLNRVARTVREDPRNRNVLYLGTEFGLFFSGDRGAHWMPLGLGMPTVPVYDMVVHPRENDLVLATHGRGVWILDNVNALQEFTAEIASTPAHLFTLEPADQIRDADETAHSGDMIFRGQNPPAGAIVDYYLRQAADSIAPSAPAITILNGGGAEIARVAASTKAGVNRVAWNLRHADVYQPPRGGGGGFFGGGRVQGPRVLPGRYTIRLAAGGATQEQPLTVRNDPRMDVSPGDLVAWHDTLVSLGALIRHTAPLADSLVAFQRRVDSLPPGTQRRHRQLVQELNDIAPKFTELKNRQIRLYREIDGWLGRPTTDQLSELAYYRAALPRYEPRVHKALQTRVVQ